MPEAIRLDNYLPQNSSNLRFQQQQNAKRTGRSAMLHPFFMPMLFVSFRVIAEWVKF